MKAPSTVYTGRFYPCYRTDKGAFETEIEVTFCAVSGIAGAEDFCRYVKRYFKQHNEQATVKWTHVGAMKFSHFQAYRITATGHLEGLAYSGDWRTQFLGFEWKCDTGLHADKPSKTLLKLIEEISNLKGEQ